MSDSPISGVAPVPSASTTVEGIVEIATQTEANTGTDALKAVTPATLSSYPFPHNKNLLINGNFDIWQRGAGAFTTTVYTADRWKQSRNGATLSTTRSTFTIGQTDVPFEPTYYITSVVGANSGASDLAFLNQRMEDVRTAAGQEVTLSFYAKASAALDLSTEFFQNFGSGGSSSVSGLGVNKVSLTTSWQKFTTTVTMPSISGKTVGTSSYIAQRFFMSAGSTYDALTDTLGNQAGTFDIAQVQLEYGAVATDFEQRPIGTELALCQRYFNVMAEGASKPLTIGDYHNATQVRITLDFPVTMRVSPTLVASSGTNFYRMEAGGAVDDFNSLTLIRVSDRRATVYNASEVSGTAAQAGQVSTLSASASVAFDAEL